MVQKIDYYAVLSRAVASLERDAYAARGAIYDREHKALLKRLISSSAPYSDADIAREEEAFRDAVRRIEFPDEEVAEVHAPRREPADAAWPTSPRDKTRAQRRELPPAPAIEPERAQASQRSTRPRWDAAYEEPPRRPIGREMDFQAEVDPDEEFAWDEQERKPRSLVKVALAYVLVTAVVLGAAALGYLYLMGGLGMSRLGGRQSQATAPSERALLYEGGQAGEAGKPVEGKATWRARSEPGTSNLVVALDAEIPDPHIVLAMTLTRVTDAGAGMSHLLELHFQKPDQLPFGGISRVSNIGMKATQNDAAESLVGTSIDIAPGQFMFGLLGVADVVQQNLERLRKDNWLDFTIIFGNGAAYTLSVEKGASGERALNQALATWGQ